MTPSADDFRALARSGPWLARELHLVRHCAGERLEGRVQRPGRVRWRAGTGPWHAEVQEPGPHEQFTHQHPVVRRPDGLVLDRPGPWQSVEDAMVENYTWVSMLDPVELASGVELSGVRRVTHDGREAWQARCHVGPDYDPRCACCPLLWSRVSDEAEYGADHPRPAEGYPEFHDVTLDHATGIVLRLAPGPGSTRTDLAFHVDLLSWTPWP